MDLTTVAVTGPVNTLESSDACLPEVVNTPSIKRDHCKKSEEEQMHDHCKKIGHQRIRVRRWPWGSAGCRLRSASAAGAARTRPHTLKRTDVIIFNFSDKKIGVFDSKQN
jgi:hypothetical protein